MHILIGHECGVAAVALKKPMEYYPKGGAIYFLYLMLNELQNRGQETCGFFSFNPNRTRTLDGFKTVGLVNDLFRVKNPEDRDRILFEYAGIRAEGHVRYATSGHSKGEKDWLDEAQPFYRRDGNPHKRFVLGWNGNIANYRELKCYLEERYGVVPETSVDTELLMYLITYNIEEFYNGNREPNFLDVLKRTQEKIDGGMSLVLMNGLGHIVAYRGVPGIMPLCYGENENLFAVASETSALARIGIKDYKFFKPGQLILYNDSLKSVQLGDPNNLRACFFQQLYFAKIVSVLDSLGVNEFREAIGGKMAEIEPLRGKLDDRYVLVPVPDTSIPAARRMASRLGIGYEEVLIKNPQAGRTFIEKDNMRKERMQIKFSYTPGKVEGRKIILVDDSIVRGNTAQMIVSEVRKAFDPEEIHLRSTCPPIVSPCFYGVDFPTFNELIAHGYNDKRVLEEELARRFEANSVSYMTIDGLLEVFDSLGFSRDNLCTACITGNYPTDYGKIRLEELVSKL